MLEVPRRSGEVLPIFTKDGVIIMFHKLPLVSVIMPTYNCAAYIGTSIESVISQTVTDWEIQIVDDCSTDDTQSVLQPYLKKYPNIHYYCLLENGGPAVARTEAIKRAAGNILLFWIVMIYGFLIN